MTLKNQNSANGKPMDFSIDPDSVKLLPHVFCMTNNVVILDKVVPGATSPIQLAMANPGRVDIIDLVSTKFDGLWLRRDYRR